MRTDPYGLRLDRQPELVPDFVSALPPSNHALALFDADGTMWTDDVADDFTQWMIRSGHIPGDRWPTYMRIYRDDAPAGCRFLLSLYTGMHRDTLRDRIEEYWLNHANRNWVWPVVESLHHLAAKGYEIWVVTGSPTDFMLPLRHMLPVHEVVGMDYEFDALGVVTGRHSGISCAGLGKAEKVRHMANGRPVRFCCGNGNLDGPMMDIADVAWAIYPNPEFAAFAASRDWPILPRPADFVEEEKFLLED